MADKALTNLVDEQATLFALGALPPEESAQFRQRLASGCQVCQAALAECERTIALLPFAAPEVQPPDDLRARLMERVTGTPPPRKMSTDTAGILIRAGDSPWMDAPVPGVQVRPLLGESTMLVRMAPKTWYPKHRHPVGEQCLVLEGSIQADGVTAYAGDFTYMPPGSAHAPLYTENGCVLLIAYA
jgi:mannose-6-phosphate isomerase-like protein (cupin superfamily)